MRRPRRAPGLGVCFAMVALMAVLPRVAGFRRTLRLARRLGGPAAGAGGDPDVTAETARRVALAAAFYPQRALCLEQSLALFVLLRRRGVPAELRLGVQVRPFYAHAWVEVEGNPINEAGDLPARLATFTTLEV